MVLDSPCAAEHSKDAWQGPAIWAHSWPALVFVFLTSQKLAPSTPCWDVSRAPRLPASGTPGTGCLQEPSSRPDFNQIEARLASMGTVHGSMQEAHRARQQDRQLLDQMLPPRVSAVGEGRTDPRLTVQCMAVGCAAADLSARVLADTGRLTWAGLPARMLADTGFGVLATCAALLSWHYTAAVDDIVLPLFCRT